MNRRSLLLTILSLTAAGITGAQAQSAFTNEFITNGNMGSFTGTLPTSWANNGAQTSYQTNNNSPFTNSYANNSSAVSLVRNGNVSGMMQSFSLTTNYQKLYVNFDFMVTSTNTGNNPWGFQFDGGGASGASSSSVHFRIDQGGYFGMTTGATSGGSTTNVMKLDPGAWYNVQAYFEVTAINNGSNNGSGFQNGTITRQSDFSSTNPLSASWNNVALINQTLGYSRVNIYDRAPAGNASTLVVDNVSVSVVPEPSEYALMALGLGLTTLVILRRRKEGQAS